MAGNIWFYHFISVGLEKLLNLTLHQAWVYGPAFWLRDPLFWCYNWSSFTPSSVANKDPPNPLRRMASISFPLNSCMDVGTNLKL